MWFMFAAFASPPDEESLRDAMAEHWRTGEELRHALVRGELADVRAVAKGWAARPVGEDELEGDAKQALAPTLTALSKVTELKKAGELVGQLTTVCSSCHVQNGRTRSWQPPKPPGAGPMERHRAGADWMWAGLVSPSDMLFEVGAKTFTFPEPTDPLTSRLEAQVRAAAVLKPGVERARAYGEILTTCSGCHRAVAATQGPETTRAEMHQRLFVLERGREAIAKGDAEGWRAAATELAFLHVPERATEGPWQPWTAELRRLAVLVHESKSQTEAAGALANLAAHCGSCHAASGAGPAPIREDELSDDTTGLDLLWRALLNGDGETWTLGVEKLGRPSWKSLPPGKRAAAFAESLVQPKP